MSASWAKTSRSNLATCGFQVTLPETNIAPENSFSQKESHLPTIHFQGRTVSFREGINRMSGCAVWIHAALTMLTSPKRCVGWSPKFHKTVFEKMEPWQLRLAQKPQDPPSAASSFAEATDTMSCTPPPPKSPDFCGAKN